MNKEKHVYILISSICTLCVMYAIIRYNIVRGVPWKDFPLFILNKGISLSVTLLLSVFMFLKSIKDTNTFARKTIGGFCYYLTLLHFVFSVLVLKPSYFSFMFVADGTFSLIGSFCLLTGVIALGLLYKYRNLFKRKNVSEKKLERSRTIYLIAVFVFSLTHLFFRGYSGWLQPSTWAGGLPPISLLSFGSLFLSLSIYLFVLLRKYSTNKTNQLFSNIYLQYIRGFVNFRHAFSSTQTRFEHEKQSSK